MASGIEVVASDVSGINDVLQSFPDNMFNPGDEHDLYEKIKAAINQYLRVPRIDRFSSYRKKKKRQGIRTNERRFIPELNYFSLL